MKLIYCPKCQDVVRLQLEKRECKCGASWGNYTNHIMAEIGGEAIPLGFDNRSFIEALSDRTKNLDAWLGFNFSAFVIPFLCRTIKKEK